MFLAEAELVLADGGVITAIIVSLVLAAASLALSELLRPKPDVQDAKPSGIGDFKFPTAIEGRPVPVIWGTVQQAGPNVLWWGDLKAKKITSNVDTGLFSGDKSVVTGFRYFLGIEMGLCLGEIDAMSALWIGDKQVFTGQSLKDSTITIDQPKLFGGRKFGTGGVKGVLRILGGTSTQTVPSYLSTHQSEAVPHRGVCTAVWEGGYLGTSTKIQPWKFEIKRFPNQLGMTGGKEIVNTNEANPACVLYEYLTNDDWGLGLESTDIDVSSFQAAGDTLYTEQNGFSFLMDRVIEGTEFLKLVQEQIDGLVYLDISTGLFTLSLARNDYDIDLVPQISEANGLIDVVEFTRATWEETINEVRISFTDRDRDYFDTFAVAQDLANQQVQGGELVSATIKMPGVKDKALATNIASREIRARSIPLAKATVRVDRRHATLVPNQVIAYTDDNLGFSKLAMRVLRVDYGDLESGEVTLALVEDVYAFNTAFFGEPDTTLWTPPTTDVGAMTTLVFENPLALIKRNPTDTENLDRFWAGGRLTTGGEVQYSIYQRNAAGTPSGAYTQDSEDITDFVYLGSLRTALTPGDAAGTQTIQLDPDLDTVTTLQENFVSGAAAAAIGSNLTNLCYIDTPGGGEFFSPETIVNQTTHLDLQNSWRGLLDTVPGTHSAGVDVYLLVGGSLNTSAITQGNNVDVQLRAESFGDETTEGEATTKQITMNNRARRPYPATQLKVNTTLFDGTPSYDTQKPATSGIDNKGLNFEWIRRDLDTYNETQGITTDANSLDSAFPTKDTTRYRLLLTTTLASLDTGLQAHWKLDEASGTRFDETVNDNDLTDVNTVTSTTGKVGDAAVFDEANNEYLEGSATTLDWSGNQSFSFSTWVRITNKTNSRAIVAKNNADGNQRQYAAYYDSGLDRFRFVVSSDGNPGTTVTADKFGSPTANTWYHVYVEHDADKDTLSISVDNGPTDTAIHSSGVYDGSATFRIGALQGGGGADAFQMTGWIDETRAYDRVLTPAERFVLYNSGSPSATPEATSVTLYDSTLTSGLQTDFVSRTEILNQLGGSLPTEDVTVAVSCDHDRDGTVRAALQDLSYLVTAGTSELDNDTFIGTLDTSDISSEWSNVPDTGTYTFTIGQDFLSGGEVLEARINGGGWSTVISAGNTTGTLASVTAADTIEVRHDGTVTGETLLTIAPPISTEGAYALLI